MKRLALTLVLMAALAGGLVLALPQDSPVGADGCDINVPSSHTTIQAAIDAAVAGQTICVAAGTYVETGQIVIDKNLSIVGVDKVTTIIKPAGDTGSTGDARGWFLVQAGKEFNLSNMTLDGEGKNIHQAIRSFGSGTIENNIIKNIRYAKYVGLGVVVMGDVSMTVRDNTFSQIERIGMMAFGVGVTDAKFIGNTYTGKGAGDYLDYGVEIGGGAKATIQGNTISNCGPSSTAWESAGILVTELYGSPTGATIIGNHITGNARGVHVGYGDEDYSQVSVTGNTFTNNLRQVHVATGSIDLEVTLAQNTFDRAVVVRGSPIKVSSIFSFIQDAIDRADPGDTVEVAAGTYNERLTINKPLTLLGAQAGVDPTLSGARSIPSAESIVTVSGLSTPNPDVLIEIPIGVDGVIVDGFTLNGNQTNTTADTSVIRCWASQVTVRNNIMDGMFGLIFKGGDELIFSNNRVTANKAGAALQPGAITDTVISGNSFQVGATPQSDRSAVYLTNCTDCSIIGNTAIGFATGGGRGVGGSNVTRTTISDNILTGNRDAVSFFGATTFLTIENNDLSNSERFGVNIKGQDITIFGNIINNCGDIGINVEKHTLDTERVTISRNHLSGNSSFGVKVDTINVVEVVDASLNWWGTTDPALAGVSGGVDFTPMIASGTDTSPDTGFQPDLSVLIVHDLGAQVGPKGRIQEGIDEVAGSTVHVAAGTYVENVTVNKSVSLLGAQADVDISSRTAGDSNESTLQGEFVVEADDVTINGFTLTRPGGQRVVFVGQSTPSRKNITIKYNMIDDVGGSSYTSRVYAVYLYRGPDNVTINNNRFNKIKADTQSVNAIFVGDTASTDPSEGLKILSNTFSDIQSGRGAYALLINNGAGSPDARIEGNIVNGLEGLWAHAIGLEGPTGNAIVSENTFSNIVDHKTPSDGIAVFFEDNPHGGTVDVTRNSFTSLPVGVGVHPKDLPGGTNGFSYVVPAMLNWWGSACGPSVMGPGNGVAVYPSVDYSPWYADAAMTTTASEGAGGSLIIPVGASTAVVQAVMNCAAPGQTVTFAGDTYPGGIVITSPGITIDLNGATVGPGSPAFTILAADVTIQGPGILDGWDGSANSSSPGILVGAGGHNFTLKDVEVRRWDDGVQAAASVTSLKLFDNFIHSNTDAGLQVDSGVTLGGVVSIQGNLFKENDGPGIRHDGTGTLLAEYNSWGHIDGPTAGDGLAGDVDAVPWTFAEVFLDMAPDTQATLRNVAESQSFDVALKVDAAKLLGLTLQFTWDTDLLTLNSTTWESAFVGKCVVVGTPPAGTMHYRCTLTSEYDAAAGTVATFNFTANGSGLTGNGPWTAHFDISHDVAHTSAGAMGGAKVFVNNAGYGAPSASERDITDLNDGQVNITGIALFTGFIDLQGRPNDAGAVVEVYDQATKAGATLLATATSAASGAYTTSYQPGELLTVGSTYWLIADAKLFLPTTPISGADLLNSANLENRPLTELLMVRLLGGDATNSKEVGITDLSCIGGRYALPPDVCGTDGWADVNGDGVVDILDLVLAAGNYQLVTSPWTQNAP